MKLKSQEVVWDKSCFDCAVTRGWTANSIERFMRKTFGYGCIFFMCRHRTDLKGKERICAAMKKKIQEWQEQ